MLHTCTGLSSVLHHTQYSTWFQRLKEGSKVLVLLVRHDPVMNIAKGHEVDGPGRCDGGLSRRIDVAHRDPSENLWFLMHSVFKLTSTAGM